MIIHFALLLRTFYCIIYMYNKCKKTVVYTRVDGVLHIENCNNYKKVITHQHIAYVSMCC